MRWGERVTPVGATDVDLPPCDRTGLELVQDLRARRARHVAAAREFVDAAAPALRGRDG